MNSLSGRAVSFILRNLLKLSTLGQATGVHLTRWSTYRRLAACLPQDCGRPEARVLSIGESLGLRRTLGMHSEPSQTVRERDCPACPVCPSRKRPGVRCNGWRPSTIPGRRS